jgi:hypothetical protein
MSHVASNGNPPLQRASGASPTTGEAAGSASSDTRSAGAGWLRQVDATLREQVETRPYVVLGAAVGLGWLLGRGLGTPVGRALAVVAGRYLVKEFAGI